MPIITLGGPLGSGASREAARGPTYAGLALERLREQRQRELTDLALKEAQDAALGRAAGAQGFADIAGLPQRAQQASAGINATMAATPFGMGAQTDPTEMFGQGLASIFQRAQRNGATVATLRELAQEGAQVERQFATKQDVAGILDTLRINADGGDAISQQLLQELEPVADSITDSMKLLEYIRTTRKTALERQGKSFQIAAKSQLLQGRIDALRNPADEFHKALMDADPTGEKLRRVLQGYEDQLMEVGMPTAEDLAIYRVMREQASAFGGGDGGGGGAPPPSGGGDLLGRLNAAVQAGDRETYNSLVAESGLDPREVAAALTQGGGGEAAPAPPETAPAAASPEQKGTSAPTRQEKRFASVADPIKDFFSPSTREPSATNRAIREGDQEYVDGMWRKVATTQAEQVQMDEERRALRERRKGGSERNDRRTRGLPSEGTPERGTTAGERAAAELGAKRSEKQAPDDGAKPKAVKQGNVWRISDSGEMSKQSWGTKEEAEEAIARRARSAKPQTRGRSRKPSPEQERAERAQKTLDGLLDWLAEEKERKDASAEADAIAERLRQGVMEYQLTRKP